MEGDVAATIALGDFDTALGKEIRRGEDVRPLGIPAQSNDRRVFEQKKSVADAAFLTQLDEALLKAQARGVIDGAELEDGDQK